jgi:hypothetical protein
MDRKELRRLSKELKPAAGVFQIKNTRNQKVFVAGTPNLKSLNGQKFMLETGQHPNKKLQGEWQEFGPEAFVFEVLEVLKISEDQPLLPVDALKKLVKKWLEKIEPYGERGYN